VTPARILVAEDEDDLRKVLAARLAASGHEVVEACDGFEAVRRVREQQPDLVILDNLMPRMNGVDACAKIKSDPATRALPVILVTASPNLVEAPADAAPVADRIFVKPYDYGEMLQAIGELLRGEGHD
jgi:two-component system phosphate regulon response regulator PhoB